MIYWGVGKGCPGDGRVGQGAQALPLRAVSGMESVRTGGVGLEGQLGGVGHGSWLGSKGHEDLSLFRRDGHAQWQSSWMECRGRLLPLLSGLIG